MSRKQYTKALRIIPFLLIAVVATIFVMEVREHNAATEKVEEAFRPFEDPTVLAQASETAFVQTVRTRAPKATAGMGDNALVLLAKNTCHELGLGIPYSFLSAHDLANKPNAETKVIVDAANVAFCPTSASSSTAVPFTVEG